MNKKKRRERVLELEKRFRWKLENLRHLLRLNSYLMEVLSDVQSFVGERVPNDDYTYHQISDLVEGVALMIECLDNLTDGEFHELYYRHRQISGKIQFLLMQNKTKGEPVFVRSLDEVSRSDINEVGGKAAHLGELRKVLPDHVPPGFVVTTSAYHRLLNENNLDGQIRALYATIETDDLPHVKEVCAEIKRYVENSLIPEPVMEEIEKHLGETCPQQGCTWAVRSSAVGEDGSLSFAGQFESILNVPPPKVANAYVKVLASRFNPHAVLYRLEHNITEAESSMAVLFIPIIRAAVSGVIYTVDPHHPESNRMVISAVPGLAAELVGGSAQADSFYLNRESLTIEEHKTAAKKTKLVTAEEGLAQQEIPQDRQTELSLTSRQAAELGKLALKIEDYFGTASDIEWAIDEQGKCWILQSRPLKLRRQERIDSDIPQDSKLLAEGGVTIYPGRAQGRLQYLPTLDQLNKVEPGVILLVRDALPQIVSVFPRLAGLITEVGHPTGHAATLAREYNLPTIFNLPNACEELKEVSEVGLDASRRRVYAGLPWPDLPQKSVRREKSAAKKEGTLDELLFRLNLVDTAAGNFSPEGCQSLHDMIRFIHEKAVTALFDIGDDQVKNLKENLLLLDTPIPLHLTVLDIGRAIEERLIRKKKIPPEGIQSIPFRALWRGIRHPDLRWAGRQSVSLSGLASVVMSSMNEEIQAARQLGARNYLIVSRDYLNFNARLAYHYSMIDALVCERCVNNYISFRFRGGGAARARRGLRAKFIAGVLLYEGFSVDRREDLVTAWYKGYNKEECEKRLEMLGILMGCARQLDMLFDSKAKVKFYIEQFLEGNYQAFH